MAFLDKAGLQNLTNKLVHGDAIKVASSKGTTVKEVIDNIQRECESVALPNNMILENRVNEFKVGQGRNIDVSRDVEEGLSQIQLQGQTYQNLCGSHCWFLAQYSSNYDIKGHNDKIIVTNKRAKDNADGWTYCYNDTLKVNMLKVSTKYTLFFKHESNFNTTPSVQFIRGSATQHLSNAYTATKIKDNIFMCVITTLSSFEDKEIGSQILYFHNATPRKIGDKITLYKNMVLLEGDYSQIPIEEIPVYFEGIKSSFEDKVANINIQGKNLFNKNSSDIIKGQALGQHNGLYGAADLFASGLIKVVPNSYYSFTKVRWGWLLDKYGKKVSDCSISSKLKIPNGCEYIRITGSISDLDNIQIEQSSVVTNYEEYRNVSYRFDIKEPLRRLPNGVCDEIRNNNGKWELVRRIEKSVFNGSESWQIAINNNKSRFDLYFNDINTAEIWDDKKVSNIVCSNLPVQAFAPIYQGSSKGINYYFANSHRLIVISLGDNCSLNEFKQWLTNNPTTVYYELETPIITPIDPIDFNVSQGTTISINSDIAPISIHEVILNRSGQIEQGIELIANLRSRIDKLEKIYDSNLIVTQYRLNNLKLNYELEREED